MRMIHEDLMEAIMSAEDWELYPGPKSDEAARALSKALKAALAEAKAMVKAGMKSGKYRKGQFDQFHSKQLTFDLEDLALRHQGPVGKKYVKQGADDTEPRTKFRYAIFRMVEKMMGWRERTLP